ncbi:MAG: T9SS type A sorting domain-containing protein [Lentimicrobium sp.]|nr:T9SS type A sorting domain-containing protein [Lentimicrobium sp.]
MKKLLFTTSFLSIIFFINVSGQPWLQKDEIFNPSGVPSLPFSQPRFADLDGDADFDMIIGSTNGYPYYMKNNGTLSTPHFIPGENIFSVVNPLDAEMGVFYDIDNDNDLDFITGGYTGLNLFRNIGSVTNPEFQKINNFFAGLNVGSNPVPDLADLDNDGDADLVVGLSESGVVKIYTNTGTAQLSQFSESSVYEIGDVGLYAYPVFCDIDNDNDQDLLVGRDGHGFNYYENTGNASAAIWQPNTSVFAGLGSDTYWNSPGLVDLDGNGTFDLIYGTASGPLAYYNNAGTPSTPVWQINTTLFGGVLDVGGASSPCFYDYDNDGDLDLFSGSQLGDIRYFKNIGTSAGPAWEENSGPFASLKHSIYSAVAIGDVNGDGQADAIVGDLSGKLYYHRNTGFGFTLVTDALAAINLGAWSVPRLADLDNDGDLDIIAGNEAGNLFYIENQGSPQSPAWVLINGYFAGIDVGSNCVPAIYDVDFDNDLDILCGDSWGDLTYLENQSGTWVENNLVFFGLSGNQNTAPAFGDLDGDGDPDLTLGQYDGTFSYFQNQRLITGLSRNNLHKTSGNVRVYPNPVNGNATIEFNLDALSTVRFDVVDYTGKIIHSQNLSNLPAGYNSHNWDTRTLTPGNYFFRITTNNETIIFKILKVK